MHSTCGALARATPPHHGCPPARELQRRALPDRDPPRRSPGRRCPPRTAPAKLWRSHFRVPPQRPLSPETRGHSAGTAPCSSCSASTSRAPPRCDAPSHAQSLPAASNSTPNATPLCHFPSATSPAAGRTSRSTCSACTSRAAPHARSSLPSPNSEGCPSPRHHGPAVRMTALRSHPMVPPLQVPPDARMRTSLAAAVPYQTPMFYSTRG